MSVHFISREEAESDLLACATYLAESIESAEGHADAISSVVTRYLELGNVDMAAELANTVDDPFTRDRLLIHVAERCAEMDDDEYALQLIDAIEEPGLQSDGRERIGMLEANKSRFEEARRIAAAMPHPDFVLSAIAVREYLAGDNEAFRSTLAEIEFPAARVSAYTGIVHMLIAEGTTEGAVELLEESTAFAAEIEHDEERIRSFVEIGTLFHDSGDNGKAIETLDKALGYAEELDNVHRDAFLAAVSVGFLRAGSQDLADRTLDLVTDKTQTAQCLVGHAHHFWEAGQKDDAIESIEEAYAILKSQRENETRNSKERIRLFGSIAAQLANFGKGERAIEIAETIDDETESMASLARIAVIFATRGEDELVRQSVNVIAEDAQRTFALIGVSDATEKAGNREAAVEHLDEALHLTESVPQLASRSSAYLGLAKRYAIYELPERFDGSIAKGIDAITAIKDESIKVTSLIELEGIVDELKIDIAPEDLDFLKTILKDVPNE